MSNAGTYSRMAGRALDLSDHSGIMLVMTMMVMTEAISAAIEVCV